ncbi:MAG TPA: cobalamin-binding protein, partial [Pyrinomonadaceae bacterium]
VFWLPRAFFRSPLMPDPLLDSGAQRILFFIRNFWSAPTGRRFGSSRGRIGAIKSGDPDVSGPYSKWLLLILVFACLHGCASRQNSITPEGPVRRQITDDSGKAVSLPVAVNRVVSLAPNLTEIVFAVGGGDRLVGRTSYCDFPPEAKSVAEVGDTLHPSLERIIALKPQVVLVSTASQLEVFTKQLQDHDIAVFVTDPHDLEGVFRSIEKIGEILGLMDQAKQTVDALRQRVAAVEQKLKGSGRVRVFYQLSGEPLYTIGKESFVNDLIQRAGAVSVTADVPGAWPKYSAEAALATKPDAIILPTGGSMGDTNASVAEPLKRSPAVVQKRVYKINDDHLVRPGPRAVDGLEEMARALHPEAFK